MHIPTNQLGSKEALHACMHAASRYLFCFVSPSFSTECSNILGFTQLLASSSILGTHEHGKERSEKVTDPVPKRLGKSIWVGIDYATHSQKHASLKVYALIYVAMGLLFEMNALQFQYNEF